MAKEENNLPIISQIRVLKSCGWMTGLTKGDTVKFELLAGSICEAEIIKGEAWVNTNFKGKNGRAIYLRVEDFETIEPAQSEEFSNINPVVIKAIEDFLKERKIQEVEKKMTWVRMLKANIVETEPGRFTHFKKDEYYITIEDEGIWVKFTKSDGKEGFFKISPDNVELVKKD